MCKTHVEYYKIPTKEIKLVLDKQRYTVVMNYKIQQNYVNSPHTDI